MRIDIATLFPEMCQAVLNTSILGRAIKNGFVEMYTHNIRDFSESRHRSVDDKPYGGGTGMVMQAQPIYDCVTCVVAEHLAQGRKRPRIIYMSPQGETLSQNKVAQLAAEEGLVLICGHYEGVDQRVIEELNAEEISVGDYVLTGGELPALIVADAVARLQPGVLPNEDAYSVESHYNGLLEYPQYTRPEVWKDRAVPQILLTGDHAAVSEWQLAKSLEVTAQKRPDMHKAYISSKIEEYWTRFKEKSGEAAGEYLVLSLPQDEVRRIIRGKTRRLPQNSPQNGAQISYKDGGLVVITNELNLPRCIARVTAIKGGEAWIKTVFKER